MLNAKGERELCYVVRIDAIEPIEGSDNCEAAVVGGWKIMVRKNTFRPGDLAIYFEIDSQVDAGKPEFYFLSGKHGKIKTQKYTFGGKGNFVSQGLLMHPADFDWMYNVAESNKDCIIDKNGVPHYLDDESRFLTQILGVTYSSAEDNSRKAGSADKYKLMAQRRPNLFKKPWAKWMMKHEWGRKIMFFFFGKKKDKKNAWPVWVVKTDEERVENMPWILNDKSEWIATEKIDGTSTTFTMKRGKKKFLGRGKNDFYVCSRNVVFDKPDKDCYYDTNVYHEMAQKYKVELVLTAMLDLHPEYDWVTLQGETYGAGIQKRDYGLTEHRFAAFNFITSAEGRWNSVKAEETFRGIIPWVPILDEKYILPDTVQELREFSHSEGSRLDGVIKEGIVFRSQDGLKSFKCVDPEFLIKYHG